MNLFPTENSDSPYGGASRPNLQQLLEEETLRRWAPEEDRSSNLAIPRPRTEAELREWLSATLGIRFPDTQVCENHSTPWRAFKAAFFAETPVTVWKASRAFGGKTFQMGALAFAESVTLRADVTVLGGSGEQSQRVHEYIRDFWRKPAAPISALATDPASKRSRLVWGNKVDALMASARSVSGPHPQRLRVDEMDLVEIELLDQALGQPMTKDGVDAHVLLSSAHYTADGTMTEILKRAAEKGWGVHEWCWRETIEPNGWLAKAEIARQRNVVTEEMWRVQYDLQMPSQEGLAINPDKVERMFRGKEIAGEKGDEFPYTEFEPPVEGASYCHGADWARTRDFVEFVTMRDDVWPLRVVAYRRFRKKPTPYILHEWEKQTGRYPGESAHDATGGGTYIADFLDESTEPVVMVGMVRRNLFVDYIVEIEHDGIVSPRIGPLYRQHRWCKNDDLFKVGGHPPDGVVAGSMAYKASSRKPLRVLGARERPPVVTITSERRETAHEDTTPETPATPIEPTVTVERTTETTAMERALGFLSRKP